MGKVFLRYVTTDAEVIEAVFNYAAVYEIDSESIEENLGITFGRVTDLDKMEVRTRDLSEDDLEDLPVRRDVFNVTNPKLGFPPAYPACIALSHTTSSQSRYGIGHFYISNVVPGMQK